MIFASKMLPKVNTEGYTSTLPQVACALNNKALAIIQFNYSNFH